MGYPMPVPPKWTTDLLNVQVPDVIAWCELSYWPSIKHAVLILTSTLGAVCNRDFLGRGHGLRFSPREITTPDVNDGWMISPPSFQFQIVKGSTVERRGGSIRSKDHDQIHAVLEVLREWGRDPNEPDLRPPVAIHGGPMSLESRLKQARLEADMTQQRAAELANLERNTIWRYETGVHEPSASTLNLLARIYDKPVEWFHGELEDEPQQPPEEPSLKDDLSLIMNEASVVLHSLERELSDEAIKSIADYIRFVHEREKRERRERGEPE